MAQRFSTSVARAFSHAQQRVPVFGTLRAFMQVLNDLVACFRLYAVCEDCHRMVPLNLPDLVEREGGNYPISRLRMRLWCQDCRSRSQALRIVYVGPEGRQVTFRYTR